MSLPARRWAVRALVILALTVAVAVGTLPATAAADPATPAAYPNGSSATWATGLGFDTCTAPSLARLQAWRSSSYRTVNIYFGGVNRSCSQPNLSATWVRDAARLGWRLLPTYVGRQPACVFGTKSVGFTASNATSYGTSDATDAAAKAKALGLYPGSGLYADLEHYDRTDSSCALAVRRYVSAWTKTLHSAGYLAGVYVHQNSGLRDVSAVYSSASYARPDAVWIAFWDGKTALTGWPSASDNQWARHQRAKQYRGDHYETWAGVMLYVDSDSIDAPVATTSYSYRVRGASRLNARSGPSTSYPVTTKYAAGTSLAVLCQIQGQRVGTTAVWDRLGNGAWVSDHYVDTPSNTTFSTPLPRCSYPGQVTSSSSLNARSGPGTSYPRSGSSLPAGSLAWVACQRAGSAVGTSSVWNQLVDGRWVSDYYVSNRSSTTYSTPVPRCQ